MMLVALPWISFISALIILAIPKQNFKAIQNVAIGACALSFAITIHYFVNFDLQATGYQFVTRFLWTPGYGITYQVGLDGINMVLCLLHALVSLAGAFVARSVTYRTREYLFYYLLLVGGIYGVFTALDMFFLYLFYELTLIPLFPMIGIWGSKNKEYGVMKLTLFITGGAMLSLFGILMLYQTLGVSTFDLIAIQEHIANLPFSENLQVKIAPLLLIGFGVIASLWPLHSWSPIGYAVAPTTVSMLHAGVLKKMGPYLIIRIAVTFLPSGLEHWSKPLAILAMIGMLYAGFAAICQKDMKYMVGFSSVSHMGYVLLGIAVMNTIGISGAVMLMFSHGVMAACTFACIGFIYEQAHVRGLNDFGGLSRQTPFLAVCFIMCCMASLGLPGFANFASEVLIFIGAWGRYPILVCLAIFGILITAIYLLRAIQKVCYGEPNQERAQLRDVQGIVEKFPFVLLLGALLLFGIWPQGLLRVIQPTVGAILS